MKEEERQWMERQVGLAMSGWPEYEVPGDEYTDPEKPVLESFPHQQDLKAYLIEEGHVEFRGTRELGGKSFDVLGSRGNLSWCCDPDCDRVLVEGGISLFINEGSGGEIALCQDCFQRHMKEGTISLGQN